MDGTAWDAVLLRPARRGEAPTLSELALRAKAYWGYDESFLDACRDELSLRPEELGVRRVTVAEADGLVAGFATLDGDPPDGELGMLFVEPEAMGKRIGALLYRHALSTASQLGFRRLRIDSDPHAEGFYLRMGAEPAGAPAGAERSLLRLLARPRPEPAWVAAWTGGRPSANVGNVGEFHGMFSAGRRDGGPYACLAAFASPHPAMIVLPRRVDERWISDLSRELGWGTVAMQCGIAEDDRMSEAILSRPRLLHSLRSFPGPVLPWGRSSAFDRILPASPGVLAAVVRYESKAGAHRVFRELAPGHPDIVVPTQRRLPSRRSLVRALAGPGPLVVKDEYGVGGHGTHVLSGRCHGLGRLLRAWPREGVLLEEYVTGADRHPTPTFDAVIDDDGAVHPVGAGLMSVAGTSYQGVVVGPGVLPDEIADSVSAFGRAVGRRLSLDGYRGWYDVDFVTGRSGRLAPTEINLRLTGPAAAFSIQARLDRLRGGRHLVRTLDCLPLGARLRGPAWQEHLARIVTGCRELGATLLVTIPTATFEPAPYVGVAIAARSRDALDAAEVAVRGENRELEQLFRDFSGPGRSPRKPGRRTAARRRASE